MPRRTFVKIGMICAEPFLIELFLNGVPNGATGRSAGGAKFGDFMVVLSDSSFVGADRDLEARVINNLAMHHVPGVRWLDIRARNGVVTLRGRVRSFHQRQLCVHCSRRVAGVFELVDRLEVVESSPMVAAS